MVSKREVKRIFKTVAPHRQLPDATIEEFAFRAESLLKSLAEYCELEAGGEESNKRLTIHNVKLAYLKMKDSLDRSPVEEQAKEEEKEEEEFGEWNNELE